VFHSYRILLAAAALVVMGILSGCGSRVSDKPQKTTAPAKNTVQEMPGKPADHASHEGHEQVETTPTGVPAGLAELSAEDRAAAEKQRVCPVSGDVLGEHDKPYKVTVKGQVVFLCCSACEKQLLANPDKYLTKLHSDKPK
jgi:YHS domain-containing protein